MPRIARIIAVNHPHHVTQRGNYRQVVFLENRDYEFYLKVFNEYCLKNNLLILAYCLMPNHVHFIVIPDNAKSLAKTFNVCHMRYAHYFNKKKSITGHLWQGRFYSCALDEIHLYAAVRYVENNPVRARLVRKASQWKWSSARYHIKNDKSMLILSDIRKYVKIDNWEKYLCERGGKEMINKIRKNTLTGRPLGTDIFVKKLEDFFGKRLKALAWGRPKKEIKLKIS